MEDTSPKPKQSGRSSRRLSIPNSRGSSVTSLMPESSNDAKWQKYLVDLLGEENADYFINPKPKEHRVVIDPILYRCHVVDEAWGILRQKADQRLRERSEKPTATKMKESTGKDSLDDAYFAFGRYLLTQKGRIFPPRIFSDRAEEYLRHLEKLSDKNARIVAARYLQETGVSYRAACVNSDRCAHLIEQATSKGSSQFNAERHTEGSVFAEDFSDYESSITSNRRSAATDSTTYRRKAVRHPRLIFLSSADAAEEAERLPKLWSRRGAGNDGLPDSEILDTAARRKHGSPGDVKILSTAKPDSAFPAWEPLSLSAVAEWGKVISKS